MDLEQLKQKSRQLWCETLKLHRQEPGIRIASSLSCVELLTVLFYGGFLKLYPDQPYHPDRDRFIASKGHGAAALYPILADLGFFPADRLNEVGSPRTDYGMIPDPGVPGVETVNGSLGHGLGVGAGMALSLKQAHHPAKVVVLHGDGELGEGSVWEAAAFAGEMHLNNLFLLLDVNRKSMLGTCRRNLEQWERMFQAFSWETAVCAGHDPAEIRNALTKLFSRESDRPSVLLLDTVKGHGVPELERSELAHVMSLKPERIEALIAERMNADV